MSLGGGSSSSKQQSQQTSNPVLDQQGIDMRNANGVRALGIADSPFQPYGGQFTAPLTGDEQLGVNLGPGAVGGGAGRVWRLASGRSGFAHQRRIRPQRAIVHLQSAGSGLQNCGGLVSG